MYVRKTRDIYVLLGDYGYGWDEILIESTKKDILARLKEYQENEPNYLHKIKKKRVKL